MSTLGWIAVPGGRVESMPGGPVDRDVTVLRVLIVPRLQEQLTGTALADWPATINEATPVVEVQRPGQPAQALSSTLRRAARSEAWQGFFAHGIEVIPWQPPGGYHAPTVSPTLDRLGALKTTYKTAANSPGDAAVVRQQLATWQAPPASAPTRSSDPAFAKVDFHRAVSLLREHPYVLRMLGLVVELELPANDLPRSTGEPHALVRVHWPESPIPVESPWTAYEYDGVHFLPAPSGDIRSGLVDLSDEDKWEVVTVDVDGGVGKLHDAARAVLGDASRGQQDEQVDETALLPTLKSAGLQLARKNRAQQLAGRSTRGRTNTAAGSLAEQVFTADDLVLGYRIDVRPQSSNTWFSLQARTAEYTVDGQPVGTDPVVQEEGHLKPHATVKDDDGLRTDEIVGRWSGWSLAVARPTFEGRQATAGPTDAAAALIPYKFTMHFEVAENTLPELRFGEAYQLRARVADVAGGGLRLDDPAADSHPTGLVPYTRYEPVPPPELLVPDGLFVPDPARPGKILVDPDRLGPSGTLERLIVRTAPAPDGFSTAEFDGNAAYPANDRRTFSPPATTFQLAEQHGVLSIADETGWSRAIRANGIDPSTQLPDPVALGAAATMLKEPGGLTDAITDTRPWAGTWPDHEPKQIELVPGGLDDETALEWVASGTDVEPDADAESSTVRVILPPGQHVVVELSSTILQGKLGSFAIKRLASTADADTAAIEGRHPMLTPPRRLELVHAVRRPLKAPSGSLTTSRPAGATYALLDPHDPILGMDTPSTAQLDIRADWDEWGDTAAPAAGSAPLSPLAVSRGAERLSEIRQEFGDTKHRMIRYTVTAVSRYRDYFAATDAEDEFRVATTLDAVSVKSSARPAPPVIASTVPAFSWSNAPRPGGGLVRSRSAGRLRIELGRPWFTTGEGECVAVILWPGAEDAVPGEIRSLVSWVNRDPIHPTPSPKALADESMFSGAVDPVDVPLVETGHQVRALPYPVFFDEGRWYADIEMPGAAAASYSPFVHLALARFQRDSLENLSLSTVVRTDMVPLLPDRSLDVHQQADGLHVTLTGLSREGVRPNRVVASVERCDSPDVPGAPVELTSLTGAGPGFPAWVRVADATVTGRTNEPLPALAVPAETGRLRVVVREVEELAPSLDGLVDAARELSERTVYVDVVSLPIG